MKDSPEELSQSKKAHAHTGKLGDKGIEVLEEEMKERARYTGNNEITGFT